MLWLQSGTGAWIGGSGGELMAVADGEQYGMEQGGPDH